MALTTIRRDPFSEFDAMIRRAFPSRPVSRVGGAPGSRGVAASFTPAADITRENDDALITLELPGMDFENDITVQLDGAQLVVSGTRQDAQSEDDSGRVVREIRYGSFQRSFTLPEHVTAEAISASYDAGLLTVRVTGAYAGTTPQTIAVTAGNAATASDAVIDTES